MNKATFLSDFITIGLKNYMVDPVINEMQNIAQFANSNKTENLLLLTPDSDID